MISLQLIHQAPYMPERFEAPQETNHAQIDRSLESRNNSDNNNSNVIDAPEDDQKTYNKP